MQRTITPEFLENRRVRLQRWIEKVMALRASTYSTPFLEFLDIPIHTKDRLKSPKILPEIRDDKLFPVHSICYDVISRLLIIGSGVVRPKRFMLSSKPKVLGPRGKVMVYDCEFYLSTCTTNALCETLFTTCVTAVAWDSSRNIVFVGLSSGPIVLMCLSDDKKELTYLGELDYNSDIICNLVVETYNDTFLAASRSGALFSYDLVEGQILSKATWGGARFTALAYDSRDETSFCGTTIGAFFVFDLLINPPVLLHKVILDATVATNESTSVGEITGLHFEESSRLLYVALREHIYIYRILDKVDNSPPTLWCKLSVNEKAQINNLLVLLHGRYVVAGCVNGGVAVFDMANRPDDINGVYDVITAESDMFLQGTAVDSLMLHCCEQPEVSPELFKPPADHCDDSSISLQLLPWVQVIHGSNISMRNWLRACGVEADPKACRADLIRCVADVMGADARTVAEFLMPSNPQKDVKLAWKFNSTVCSSVYVEDLRAVMFGCTDGTIQIVSLADFLAPLSEFEDQEIMDRRLSPPQRLVLDGEFSRTTRGKGQIIDKCSPDFVDSGEHDEPLTAEERESVFFNNVMAVTDETDEPEPEADRYS